MQKIPTLFVRDTAHMSRVTGKVAEGCEWVLRGEGVASRKWDGTGCLALHGRLYRRLEWDAQKGPAPESWVHWTGDPAQRSGHGWYPVSEGAEDWMHRKAWALGHDDEGEPFAFGRSYELIGPKIGKNPEGVDREILVPHGRDVLDPPCESFDSIRSYLMAMDAEGIVWAHPDGRYAKIKRRDFGFPWPARAAR